MSSESFVARCVEHSRAFIDGRSVVVGGFPLASTTRRVTALRELGAARCLVIAGGVGTGPLPGPDDAEVVVLDAKAVDLVAQFREEEARFADPPPEVVAALDRFDPDRQALVLLESVGASSAIGDRAAFGARPPEWVALEDKTVGDAMFDAAGVPRPPSRVVAATYDALRAAADELDAGDGTVWSGDARGGFNGAGQCVRWVHAGDDGRAAAEFFASSAARVRVAPFLEGVACSVHGFVTDDGVAVLRPVELVNLRREHGDRLLYAGCATFWDPDPSDRDEMRAAARRLGEHLRALVDYRGAFTLDGIMSHAGFVATECNPRPGAGLGYVRAALPQLPFDILQYLAVARVAPWLRAAELEAELVDVGDRVRWGGGWTALTTPFAATTKHPLAYDGSGFGAAAAGAEPHATLSLGPGASGGFLRVEFDAAHTPVGPPIGPRVAEAFAYADAAHATGIGPVRAARPAR